MYLFLGGANFRWCGLSVGGRVYLDVVLVRYCCKARSYEIWVRYVQKTWFFQRQKCTYPKHGGAWKAKTTYFKLINPWLTPPTRNTNRHLKAKETNRWWFLRIFCVSGQCLATKITGKLENYYNILTSLTWCTVPLGVKQQYGNFHADMRWEEIF